jgi:hypothetical protein
MLSTWEASFTTMSLALKAVKLLIKIVIEIVDDIGVVSRTVMVETLYVSSVYLHSTICLA